ncbi:MAG: sensor histidine kinase [Firmicutes bacterium]|nr:sensor histidine kinase [Bacillota bacterium]
MINFLYIYQHGLGPHGIDSWIAGVAVLFMASLVSLRFLVYRHSTMIGLLGLCVFTTGLVLLSSTFSFLWFVDLGLLGFRLTTTWIKRLSIPLLGWTLWILVSPSSKMTWYSMSTILITSGAAFGFGWMLQFIQEADSQRKSLIEQISRANDELATSAIRDRQLATLEERTRIARDLHDTVGNAITTITVQLEALTRLVNSGKTEESLRVLTETKLFSRNAMRQLRESVTQLRRPSMSIESELQASLLSAKLRNQWTVHWDTGTCDEQLSSELKYTILRIGQELFTNIERHARASDVWVTLQCTGKRLVFSVRDDGQGFTPNQIPPGHFGLLGIRERLGPLHGSLRIDSALCRGTTLTIELPLTPEDNLTDWNREGDSP